jgi:hypothetical protein
MMERALTIKAMADRIALLCENYEINISWCKRPTQSYALQQGDEICIAPVRSAVSYCTALHEIGHIRGRYQISPRVMVRERAAWAWARSNALVWTPIMERSAQKSLDWYAPRAVKLDAKRRVNGHLLDLPTRATAHFAD